MPEEPKPITPEIVDEHDTPAALEAPSCTRELFLRPPDWRYQAASEVVRLEKKGMQATVYSDPYVQFAVRGLKGCSTVEGRKYVTTLWPHFAEALQLGTLSRRTAIAAEIESCIISGVTAKEVAQDGFYVPALVYELYNRLFFDLDGIRAIHSWMNDFLFEPEKHQMNSTLLRARLVAYYGGKRLGAQASVTGMGNVASESLMKKLAQTERQKKLFDYMVRITHMDTETYVTLMETAVKNMTERDFQEHMKDRDEAGSGTLEALAEHLEQGIRAFSQQELESPDKSGLDFVNQYTAAILQKGE